MSLMLNNSPFFDLLDAFDSNLANNNQLANSFFKVNGSSSKLVPPVDLVEKEKEFELRASVPGAAKENISIDFNNETKDLKISGTVSERKVEKEEEGSYYKEIESGSFERVIRFGKKANVDEENIKANYKDGVLSVVIPKLEPKEEPSKFKKIEIS